MKLGLLLERLHRISQGLRAGYVPDQQEKPMEAEAVSVNKFTRYDWLIWAAVASLVCGPLVMAPRSDCPINLAHDVGKCFLYQGELGRIIAGTHVTDWVLAVVGVGQYFVLVRQAAIYSEQRRLMEGQLKATQASADAALAALARPWIFIEKAHSNVSKWLEDGNADLIAKFTLANYGNAPAHVSYLQVALFPGPHHHNGMPKELRTERIIDFPEVDSLEYFIVNHARQCDADGGFKSHAFNKVIRQNEGVSVSVFGQPPLGPSNGPGLRLECTAEIYMIGRLYYAVPSQGLEQMTFCLKSQNAAAMEVFKDYPPFNERRKVLQSGGT